MAIFLAMTHIGLVSIEKAREAVNYSGTKIKLVSRDLDPGADRVTNKLFDIKHSISFFWDSLGAYIKWVA